ncbi:hypothetical protein [Vibrio navarrensis]|uniref:NAD(+) hydrolase ThsA Sir2/TIR-associating SLOG domain-containing protein n=1 Tax=Vibrio navarrensis TaxID=29495 RepID=A0A099LT41_9VIBR|nr:hypothetical protein [Vibrio navarrensis]KGK10824.1 hypothetical protein EA26_05725 [Vibrio navarrensis]MBE4616999.1 hypothetical protein [Vibrio navarrensis]
MTDRNAPKYAPQTEVGTRPIAQVWHDYRTDMISFSGIAIFLFGNKLKDGEVVVADGLIKEFKIAKSNGLLLIPVGATEYASREIYCELLKEGYFDSDAFPESARKFIDKICDKESELTTIQSEIIDLLKSLK